MSESVFKLSRVSGAPISDEELMEDLRRVAEICGIKNVTKVQYKKHGKYGVTTQQERFGTWNKALLRARLEIWKEKDIADDRLFENIRILWEHYGRPPRRNELASAPSIFSHEPYYRRFGNWINTLYAFVDYANGTVSENGLGFKIDRVNTPISDEELIKDLRRVAEICGTKNVTVVQYEKRGRYSATTQIRRFGTWNHALLRSSRKIPVEKNISDSKLFDNVLVLWQHYGRQPRVSELALAPSYISQRPYYHRFGSWMNALRAFVDYANGTGGEATESTIEEATETPITNAAKNVIDETTERHIEEIFVQRHKTGRFPSTRLRWRVLQRDNFKCCACGTSPAITLGVELHVDHIYPWEKGGETVLENLQTLCSKCNLGKSNLLPA